MCATTTLLTPDNIAVSNRIPGQQNSRSRPAFGFGIEHIQITALDFSTLDRPLSLARLALSSLCVIDASDDVVVCTAGAAVRCSVGLVAANWYVSCVLLEIFLILSTVSRLSSCRHLAAAPRLQSRHRCPSSLSTCLVHWSQPSPTSRRWTIIAG
jgi:hypothetical protein